MVRHDPANERGPAPPGGRQIIPPSRPVAETLFQLQPVEEYEKLWLAATSGANSSLETLAGYIRLDMPVSYLDTLYQLKNRLNILIEEAEARNEL